MSEQAKRVKEIVSKLRDPETFCAGCGHHGEPCRCNMNGIGCKAWDYGQEAADLLDQLQRETYRNSTQVTGYCPICAERAKQEQQEPKPRDWTPCAEGLPEDNSAFEPMSRCECTILIPDGTREVFTLHRTGNGKWLYETGKGLDTVRGDQVVAWRKVSDPYNPDHFVDANKKIDQNDVSQWPGWKKRAALCNYELGKED